MADPEIVTATEIRLFGADILRKNWGRFVGLGIFLVLLGTLAIGYSIIATEIAMVFIGWLMIMGGVLQTAHGFTLKEWGGFFLDLFTGLLYSIAGLIIIAHPAATAVMLTLFIAMLLIFGGIFRIVLAIADRFHHGMWLFIHGAINLLLGISICQSWPISGLWVIGLFIGIDMLFNGWSLIMLGLAAKGLPDSSNSPADKSAPDVKPAV